MYPDGQIAGLLPFIERFAAARVGVIGDLMVDRFIYGDAQRISPEAPVPVVQITRRTTQPGGAANVANNVRSMGGRAFLFGVLGDDDAGHEVEALLASKGVQMQGVVFDNHRPSTVKTRIVAQTQQLVRFDEEETSLISDELTTRLLAALQATIGEMQVLVISDYAKGLLNRELIAGAVELAHARHIPVIADPKPLNIHLYAGVDVLKPNMGEALRLARREHEVPDGEMEQLCREVRAHSGTRDVMITAGARGMFVLCGEELTHLKAWQREVYDVAGAGDTALAAIALAIAGGARLTDAARLGNLAGSIAVGKLGIAAVTTAELVSEIEMAHGCSET